MVVRGDERAQAPSDQVVTLGAITAGVDSGVAEANIGVRVGADDPFTPSGYSRSGDLGVMDADGYVRVTGRTKDIVIRGGMNLSVREIEDLLVAHPGVRNAAVVGMPDERLGERMCCYLFPPTRRRRRPWPT